MKELLKSTRACRAFSAEEPAHATLVVFPDGKYLRALLRACAAAFFGADEGSRTGELIAREQYADCLFFPAEGGKLTADDCARIVDESLLRPVEGEKKLFVLDGFDTVTQLLQNKLLKLLEEPPEGVYFLLGAVSRYPVLPTVLSRVRVLTEPPFREEEVLRVLLRQGGEEESARRAAAASGGVVSLAEKLMGGGGSFALAERFLSEEDKAPLCRELEKSADAPAFFAALRLCFRDALLLKLGMGEHAASPSAAARAAAEEYPAGALVAAVGLVSDAERDIQFNANLGQAAYALALAIGKEKERWKSSL